MIVIIRHIVQADTIIPNDSIQTVAGCDHTPITISVLSYEGRCAYWSQALTAPVL